MHSNIDKIHILRSFYVATDLSDERRWERETQQQTRSPIIPPLSHPLFEGRNWRNERNEEEFRRTARKSTEPSFTGWFDREKGKTRLYRSALNGNIVELVFWIFRNEMASLVRTGRGCCKFYAAISGVRNSRSNPCEPIWRASGKIIHRLPASEGHGTSRAARRSEF